MSKRSPHSLPSGLDRGWREGYNSPARGRGTRSDVSRIGYESLRDEPRDGIRRRVPSQAWGTSFPSTTCQSNRVAPRKAGFLRTILIYGECIRRHILGPFCARWYSGVNGHYLSSQQDGKASSPFRLHGPATRRVWAGRGGVDWSLRFLVG